VEHIVTVYISYKNILVSQVFIPVVVRIYGVNEKLSYIRNSCYVYSQHCTMNKQLQQLFIINHLL
jgi:hypothetical protein